MMIHLLTNQVQNHMATTNLTNDDTSPYQPSTEPYPDEAGRFSPYTNDGTSPYQPSTEPYGDNEPY